MGKDVKTANNHARRLTGKPEFTLVVKSRSIQQLAERASNIAHSLLCAVLVLD
jgi:hypothetical protein